MAAKTFRFNVTFLTGDEVVYVSTQSELKYAILEITQGKYLNIDDVQYNAAHIFKFEVIKD